MGKRTPASSHLELGFSLFEILITVVVISIGLLGLAGLQFAGLRAANGAQQQTNANLLAQDIEERIRANQDFANYAPLTISKGGSAPSAPKDCAAANCNATEIHEYDLRQWFYMINDGGDNTPVLANGKISISKSSVIYTINISWGDSSGPQTLTTKFTL